jgi:hypothetical protein
MTLDINDFDHYRNSVDEFPTSTAAVESGNWNSGAC